MQRSVVARGTTARQQDLYLSPGIRWAYNFKKNDLQIVPGVGFPWAVGPGAGQKRLHCLSQLRACVGVRPSRDSKFTEYACDAADQNAKRHGLFFRDGRFRPDAQADRHRIDYRQRNRSGRSSRRRVAGWDTTSNACRWKAHRFNVWATRPAIPIPQLVLSTHMDMVPPFIASSETDERIYGRGSCDAKGIIVAQIAAAEKLKPRAFTLACCFWWVKSATVREHRWRINSRAARSF